MSIILITGNHPRHHYFVNELVETGLVTGWIREVREEFIPETPSGLNKNIKKLYDYHFLQRSIQENEFFGIPKDPDIDIYEVDKDSLNGEDCYNFLKTKDPNLVLSYGCHKLDNNFLNCANAVFWNSHGGLSPDYRGVITHFWPSYFLEPQMTGMTLHETTEKIDGGSLIFQSSCPMVQGDTLHMLACRTVANYCSELRERLLKLDLQQLPSGSSQKSTGKIFRSSDWRPDHLKVIYETYQDKIVDLTISNEIQGRIPKLISVI